MIASFVPVVALFQGSSWRLARNITVLVVCLLWLATAYWTFKDARRRIADPWLVGLASLVGLLIPFVGPIVYMFFRPPEYLEDARERELEIKAIEQRLAELDQRCPVCRAPVEPTYLVCPVCTTRLKQSCGSCGQPLESVWQICPYCTTPVPPSLPVLEDVSTRPRRTTRRTKASE